MSKSVSVFPIQAPIKPLTLTFSRSILMHAFGLSQAVDFNSVYFTSKEGTIFIAARPWMVSLMASCVSTNPYHPNFRLLFMRIDFSNMEIIKQEIFFPPSVYATKVQPLHPLSQNSLLAHLTDFVSGCAVPELFSKCSDLRPL